jgi:hypothetical protein
MFLCLINATSGHFNFNKYESMITQQTDASITNVFPYQQKSQHKTNLFAASWSNTWKVDHKNRINFLLMGKSVIVIMKLCHLTRTTIYSSNYFRYMIPVSQNNYTNYASI